MNHTWGNRKKQSCPFILFFQYPTDKLKSHIIQVLQKASYVNTIPTLVRWKSYSRSELYFLISLQTIWRTQVYIYIYTHTHTHTHTHIYIYIYSLYIYSIAYIYIYIYIVFTCNMWDLSSQPGTESALLALEVQSHNHWTTREVPGTCFKDIFCNLPPKIFNLVGLGGPRDSSFV